MIHHIKRATRHLIFWGLIAAALAITAIRLLLSVIDIYKSDLEAIITQEISAPVRIGHLGAGMRGFRPELILKEVSVLDGLTQEPPPITVKEIRLSMDLLKSYAQRPMLASSWITLIGLKATVIRHSDGQIEVHGLKASKAEPPLWIMHPAQFELLKSQLVWIDQQQKSKPAMSAPQSYTQVAEGLMFQDVNLVLNSDQEGLRHSIKMLLALPKDYGGTTRIAMQLRGNFLAQEGITGLIYVEGQQLQLAKWLSEYRLPLDLQITDGQGTLQLWSYWQKSSLQALTGISALQQVLVKRTAQQPLLIKDSRNRFNWVRDKDSWKVRVDELALDSSLLQVDNFRLEMAMALDDGALQRVALQAEHLDLQQAAHLSQFLDASDSLPFSAKHLRGHLNQFQVTVDPPQEKFSVNGAFHDVVLRGKDGQSGLANLSGSFQGNQAQGQINLALQQTALVLPHVFARPLPINTLNAQLNWQQTDATWRIASSRLDASVPDLKATSRLNLSIDRSTHAVWMELQSDFTGSREIKAFGDYWPVGLMDKGAADWLNQAFLKGDVAPKGLLFAGALADFPFEHQEGVFELMLGFKGVDLNYNPDWQPVRAIDADVLFYNDSIQITSQRAFAQGAPLEQFNIELASFAHSQFVEVAIKGNPDIKQTLAYLQASPVKSHIEQLTEIIIPQGLAPINLTIKVPIVDSETLQINGALTLDEVALTVVPLSLPVKQLKGDIHFNETGLLKGDMHAQVLGDALDIALKTNAKSMLLDMQGHVDIFDLQEQFPSSAWRYAHGDTDYELLLTLPKDTHPAELSLQSTLQGVRLRLPDVLAKSAKESRPFELTLGLSEQRLLPLSLHYGGQLALKANVNAKEKILASATLAIGSAALEELPVKGGVLSIALEECSLNDWWALTSAATQPQTEGSTPFFEHVNLEVQQATVQEQGIGPLVVKVQQWPQEWRIDVVSPILKGRVVNPLSPLSNKPIRVGLEYVSLSDLSQLHVSNEPADGKQQPQAMPLFKLTSQQVLWGGVNIGTLVIDTERSAQGLEFKQLSIQNAQGGLDLTGAWLQKGVQQLTSFKGALTLKQFGRFLSKLNITPDLKGTDLKADIDVFWAGAPQNVALERIQGRVAIELNNGRILSIEPGFGRLLGFLAFEQWGRRLRLDFSDMLSKGLTFNAIRGDFDLTNGEAITRNLVMDAVPAEVRIKGAAHLSERSLDYRAKVLPKSSAALPIAGTIVDRVLTFTLESLTGSSQAGFLLGSEYKILGKWDNPQVIRLRENDGLLQKTWNGLTDFSWLKNNSKQK